MRKTGYNSTLKQMADAFKDSAYPLDHANKIGRENLQNGIEAPDSGSYLYNLHCDDLDWQINADFVGQLYPGAPDKAAARAFELGHITNYGDGVYGGVFVAALNAAAYTASGIDEIIRRRMRRDSRRHQIQNDTQRRPRLLSAGLELAGMLVGNPDEVGR